MELGRALLGVGLVLAAVGALVLVGVFVLLVIIVGGAIVYSKTRGALAGPGGEGGGEE